MHASHWSVQPVNLPVKSERPPQMLHNHMSAGDVVALVIAVVLAIVLIRFAIRKR
jgi:hypothetical protein